MATEPDSADQAPPDSVVVASFANRHSAEHMLASLGRPFRLAARKHDAEAFIVSEHRDGSLKLTESRVVSGSGLTAAILGLSAATMAGMIGIGSALKGAKSQALAVRAHQSHVGKGAERVHEILAQAGPYAAIALVRCKDPKVRTAVVARAAERSHESWNGSREEFLAAVDPSSEYDWVRTALAGSSDHE